MAVSIDDVIRRIEGSGIMDDAGLSAVRSDADQTEGDAEKFVRLLVEDGLLTVYQARAIWNGYGHKLSFGNYVIESELGRGGMGVVLKARHKRMKRHVAIKVLPATMTRDAEAVARFQREVEAAAQLTHANIVSAFDADEINGEHFLIMEFVDGRDLSSIIKQNGSLTVGQSLNFILQAATGLEFAHRQGVIHRDVKPANLLLDINGTVRILDMGLARFSDTAEFGNHPELTGTGTVMGTVDYMSPEQALNTKTVDSRSDIYSLGITLFYFLTAKPAYEGDTFMARLVAHREKPIPSLRDDRPDITESIQQAFEKMVAKQADDRFQSMEEVIAALEQCRVESGSTDEDNSSLLSIVPDSSEDAPPPNFLDPDDLDFGSNASNLPETASLPRSESDSPTVVTSSISSTVPAGTSAGVHGQPGSSSRSEQVSGIRARVFAGISFCVVLISLVIMAVSKKNAEKLPTLESVSSHAASPSVLPLNDGKPSLTRPTGSDVPLRPAPELAVAPFDAEHARVHQQAWAEYLDMPVEFTHPCGVRLRLIPPGRFMMGASEDDPDASDSEKPQHEVTISKPFQMGMTEVTIGQFRRFIEATGYQTEAEVDGKGAYQVKPHERQAHLTWHRFEDDEIDEGAIPVTCVSWSDAAQFCAWLGETDECSYRLPTEAEWEYACRAGSSMRYSFGNDFDENFASRKGANGVQAVGTYPANSFGLFDMHGNVHEICLDAGRTYAPEPVVDPLGPELDTVVVRSGAVSSSITRLRSSHRYLNDKRKHPDENFATTVKGFRVIRMTNNLKLK